CLLFLVVYNFQSSTLYMHTHLPRSQSYNLSLHDALPICDELTSTLEPKELEARLIQLHRQVRNDLAEGGANTLFLAVGFLRWRRSEEHTSELQSRENLVCRLLLEKKIRFMLN